MKKLFILLVTSLMISGCDLPQKSGEEVRAVRIGDSHVDDDLEELHVTIKDTTTSDVWDVNLGSECAGYPFTLDQQFLVRFDVFTQGKAPKEILSIAPQQSEVFKALCGN